ncbi:methyltransferase domain-containing protein [Microbispora triticiradicis]|uniref:methyltransferase domain-containing protein n=1 Tax=Microbispora triticiradicis TaxID=2200763 RepID=UPI001AD6DBEB|nr:methyltransferase domain-containing protein [Microbispora triticiradicis]MBO4270865.1 methyltransferase domain-containing protein [Microbispora triticiradicis]
MDDKIFQAGSTAEAQSIMEEYLERISRHEVVLGVRASALDLLSVGTGERVLDAGCGLGEVARDLARLVGPTGSVMAVDINPVMLAAARRRHVVVPEAGTITYRIGDVASLDHSGAFDVVWCERVLQHVADPDSAVRALARTLAPGGRLCVIDVDWSGLVVDGVDQTVTARVLDAFRGKVSHPTVGRTLRRRLLRAGLVDPVLRAVQAVSTRLDDAASVVPVLDRRESGLVPDVDRSLWFQSLDLADAGGELTIALPIYVVVARRPR